MSDMEAKVTRVGVRSEAGLAFAGSERVSNRPMIGNYVDPFSKLMGATRINL
jgi:hypothetical protein